MVLTIVRHCAALFDGTVFEQSEKKKHCRCAMCRETKRPTLEPASSFHEMCLPFLPLDTSSSWDALARGISSAESHNQMATRTMGRCWHSTRLPSTSLTEVKTGGRKLYIAFPLVLPTTSWKMCHWLKSPEFDRPIGTKATKIPLFRLVS